MDVRHIGRPAARTDRPREWPSALLREMHERFDYRPATEENLHALREFLMRRAGLSGAEADEITGRAGGRRLR